MAKFFFTQIQNVDLIAENGNPTGGSVVETLVWMKALHDLGQEVIQAKHADDERSIQNEYKWIQLEKTYSPTRGIKWLRWGYYRLPSIYKALKKRKPKYVYESIPSWNSVFVGMLCKKLGIKFIIRIANDNMLDSRILLTHSRFEKFTILKGLKNSDYILAQNEFQYQTLVTRFPEKKILKIYNPIVVQNRDLKPKQEQQGYFAWVANFRYQKNLKLLFDIAMKLPNETFKVAGAPLRSIDDETEEFVGKLKTLPNVEFVGKVSREEILGFLSDAKFLINTSRYEGFSNTFLEAMVVGTPILTTPGVNPDGIIDEFDLGVLYKNEEDLWNQLSKLDNNAYSKKSFNCIEFVKHNHDHKTLGRNLLKFLGE